MTDRATLAAHLRLFKDLGVNGVSREPSWRERRAVPGHEEDRGSEPAAPASAVPQDDPAPLVEPAASLVDAPVPASAGPAAPALSADEAAFAAVPLSPPDEGLAALRAHIGVCTRCQLSGMGRRQVVFGVGNPQARLMFVGEGPGADEDQQGEPFVGQAGQLLTKIIAAIDFSRADVYIANVVKCRPPGNRNPEPVEVATCSPFLLRQIDIIRPVVIVALGAFAAQTLLQTKVPISRLRGHVHDFRPGTKVIPTFHPSFLLRNRNNRDLYRDVWEDVKKARALLTAP